jgi:hypothetical protein
MKSLFSLLLLLFCSILSTLGQSFLDPTGTYMLKGEVKNNQIGYSGELRVRLLDGHTVAMCLYLNRGYPGFESGSVMDTLNYEGNRAIYMPAADTSCSVFFAFDKNTAEMFKSLSDPHSSCGFRPGVLVPAIFQKTSSDVPVIQDLSKHGVL